MLVVISDLHFEEERSNYIGPEDDDNSIRFSRNLSKKAFELVISRLAKDIERSDSKIERLDLVFAGDIFDLHRTGLWFTENNEKLRPYYNNADVKRKPELHKMLLNILERIQEAQGVEGALAAFRLLADKKYMDGKVEKEFPVKCVKFHYIPGNHDRLINATPELRNSVRKALGIPLSDQEKEFPNILKFEDYFTVIRHGHEYDPFNFSADYTKEPEFPGDIGREDYDEAPIGDFVTVDVASRIPDIFRQRHKEDEILKDPLLRALYLRLLEFDDLRPQRALFNYLLNMPKPEEISENDWQKEGQDRVWEIIKPVLEDLFNEISNDKFLMGWLNRLDTGRGFGTVDAIKLVFRWRLWRLLFKFPLSWIYGLSTWIVNRYQGRDGARVYAAKEADIKTEKYHFVVAGHTHHPATELILNDGKVEKYYLDTGTWRNQVPASPKLNAFGRLKALTYVVIYNSKEDVGDAMIENKYASVDFWSGITQRWEKRNRKSSTNAVQNIDKMA